MKALVSHAAAMKGDPERGKRIHEARKSKFASQQALADAMRQRGITVTRGAVGNWELGKGIEGDKIKLIAELTGYSVGYLWAGDPPDPPDNASGERLRLIHSAYPELLQKIGVGNPFTWAALIEGLGNISPRLARMVAEATGLPVSYVLSGSTDELTREQALKFVPGSHRQPSPLAGDSHKPALAGHPARRSGDLKRSS